jgi:1,4-alpha-glucan branching enzyme
VISFVRKSKDKDKENRILVACNFTPVPRHSYRMGVPQGGFWEETLNSDAELYGGSGQGNFGGAKATSVPFHGRAFSLSVTLPPLGVVFFKSQK